MPIPTTQEIDEYEAAPARIAAAIAGLSEAQMRYSPGEGEWSAHEVVIHLPDSEVVAFDRLRRTLVEEKAAFQAYNEAVWAQKLSYTTQDRTLALSLFAALRHSTAALLRTLPAEAWARTAMHAKRGEMSLYDLFKLYLGHGQAHLGQIERLKQTV